MSGPLIRIARPTNRVLNERTEYGKRMKRLSQRIFGEITRPTDTKSLRVAEIMASEPWEQQAKLSEKYYPNTPMLHYLVKMLKLHGLYFDEHLVWREVQNEIRISKANDGSNARKTGINFKGILPFNEPKYTELKDPPFQNLYGVDNFHEWMTGIHRIGLNQFTDVTRKEKAFFLLWNGFIVKRINRQLGVCQLFALLKRFIDTHGKELLTIRKGLVTNFILHCANFENFGYISNSERAELMDYAALKLSSLAKEFEGKMKRGK
ncbi:hypothetical protein niasHS_005819 [Heterodera schachtii]|uniref:Small ribosomal subunit protein mS33 n=1 Tax=Heterodera schachtii TaxID=97005 RepID=A0ABD2JZK6_HETSC